MELLPKEEMRIGKGGVLCVVGGSCLTAGRESPEPS